MKEIYIIKSKHKPQIGDKWVIPTGVKSPFGMCKAPVVVVKVKKSWWQRKYRVYLKPRLPEEDEII